MSSPEERKKWLVQNTIKFVDQLYPQDEEELLKIIEEVVFKEAEDLFIWGDITPEIKQLLAHYKIEVEWYEKDIKKMPKRLSIEQLKRYELAAAKRENFAGAIFWRDRIAKRIIEQQQ